MNLFKQLNERKKALHKRLILLVLCLATLAWIFSSYFHVLVNPVEHAKFSPINYDVTEITKSVPDDLQSINFQVSNPQSPFYGMHFAEKYSFPTKSKELQNYREVYSDWRPYLPNLTSAIAKRKKLNTDHDVITRTASISVNTKMLAVGGNFEAILTSLDGKGKRKMFGGDYYRVRLFRGSSKTPDAIPCRITDNNDGTYTIKAPLLFEGQLNLKVTLVTPLEGILEMIKETEKMLCDDRGYIATLENKEKVVCSASYQCLRGKPICDYSSPQNNATWICEQPPSRKCGPITDMYHNHEYKALKTRLQRVCKVYGCHVPIKENIIIEVLKSDKFNYQHYWTGLPHCKELFHKDKSSPSKNKHFQITGFGKHTNWNSLVCRNNVLMKNWKLFQKCLENKVIYYLGDSTVRHFYLLTAEKMKLEVINLRKDNRAWQQPKVAYDTKLKQKNITIYFRCHGTPMQNPGPPDSRPFIADTISNIPVGGRDVFVVINLGAHFYRFDPTMYIQRFEAIQKAIIKHHRKFPETRFIVKGLNVAFDDFLCWEWTIYRLEQIAKTLFTDMNNVLFLDLWDFSTAWPLADIHPQGLKLEQQWFLLHSLMCD